MTLTANTITDAQIQFVRRAMIGVPRKTSYHRSILKDCDAALEGSQACRESAAHAYNKMLGESPPAGKLTADSITDMQIRELLDALNNDVHAITRRQQDVRLCKIAIGYIRKSKVERAAACAHCAELLNKDARARCRARGHAEHIGDVCEGSCCTSCGGPIDENEECRC